MKKLLFILLDFGLCVFLFSQHITFNIGDNIIEYINKNPPPYLKSGISLLDSIPEGQIDFLKYKIDTVDEDIKFLAQDHNIIGIMQSTNGVTTMLYDWNGDGTLDVEYNSIIMPHWVLSVSSRTKKQKKNNLSKYLDNGIELFNGTVNPYSSGIINQYIDEFINNTDVTIPNRDLFFGFFLYYYSLGKTAMIDDCILTALDVDYTARFGKTHPLILLHRAETYLNMGNKDKAMELFDALLKLKPDFVPAKLYSWQLETNEKEQQRKYIELKTKYPQHWIVVQI
jgi:tetratricopeptide (TPR) repeat protein